MSIAVLRPGDMCGPYEIVREIGRGGMAIVYLGRSPEGAPRAIKTLELTGRVDDARLQRFRHEVQLLSSLDHVNVVRFYEAGRLPRGHAGGLLWMALEHLEGPSLRRIIDEQGGRVPIADQLRWCKQVADGVAAAHGFRVIHRDLKPSNVAVVSDVAKVFDFNMSKFRAWGVKLTNHAARLGTMGYMAPEQLEGDEVDERTDVFALGILLHELATGEHPVVPRSQTFTAMEIVSRCLLVEPERIERLVPGYPSDAAAVARRALAKDPRARFASMAEMSEALDEALRRYLKVRRPLAVAAWTGDWSLPASLEPASFEVPQASASAAGGFQPGLDTTVLLAAPPIDIGGHLGTEPLPPIRSTANSGAPAIGAPAIGAPAIGAPAIGAPPAGWAPTVPLPEPPVVGAAPAPPIAPAGIAPARVAPIPQPAAPAAAPRWQPRVASSLLGIAVGVVVGLAAVAIANAVSPPRNPSAPEVAPTAPAPER